jgi:hypothetical protein
MRNAISATLLIRGLVLEDELSPKGGIAHHPRSSNQKSRARAIAATLIANDRSKREDKLVFDLNFH